MSYKSWQLNHVREDLQVYRELGLAQGGPELSWESLSDAIEELTGVRVPFERLRRFVMGEPTKDGGRRYPSLEKGRLDAVIAFLTDENSEGYMFPREDLEIRPATLSAMLRLMKYLNGDLQPEHRSDISSLHGRFQTEPHITDIATTLALQFFASRHEGLMPCAFSKEHTALVTMHKGREHGHRHKTKPSFEESAVERYHGWAVCTPEKSMLLLLQKSSTGENLLFAVLGIDKSMALQEPAQAMVLLEIEAPEDSIQVRVDYGSDNAGALLEQVAEAFSRQLLLFKRKN